MCLEKNQLCLILFVMVATLIQKGKAFVSAQQTSIMSAASIITAFSVVSALLGVLRLRLLGSFFGTPDLRPLADAYLVAFRIPDLLFQLLVAGVLSATFIPVYSRVVHKDGAEAIEFVRSLSTLLTIVYAVVAIVAAVFAPQIISIMTGPKFLLIDLSAQMTRIMLGSTFFLLLSNLLSGILQSHRRFLLPALSPVFYNFGIILGTVFLSRFIGIYGPALGVFLGAMIHFGIQLPEALRLGFSFLPKFSFRRSDVREVLTLMIPRGATLSTNYVEDFVGLFIVTSLGNTLVFLYSAASSLAAAPIRFFGVSIAQAALPFLSSRAREGDMQGFMKLLTQTLHQIAFFMFPAGALLFVLRIPIVRLAMGARELPWSDTVLMGRLVGLYAFSIAFLAMTHVVLRAFYALKETKTPFIIAFICMCINVVIMLVGASWGRLGLSAVALGPTVAAIIEFLLLLIFLFRKLGFFNANDFFVPQLKMLLATGLMGICLYVPMKLLDKLVFDTTRVLGLLALTFVVSTGGIVCYLVFSKILRVGQLSILTSIQGKLAGWQNRLSKTTEVLNVDEEQL